MCPGIYCCEYLALPAKYTILRILVVDLLLELNEKTVKVRDLQQ